MTAAFALFHPWSSFEALLKGIGHSEGLLYVLPALLFALALLSIVIEQFHPRPSPECSQVESTRRRLLEAGATIAVLLAVRLLLPHSQRLSLFLCGMTLAFLAAREGSRYLGPQWPRICKALQSVMQGIAFFMLAMAALWIWIYMILPYID